MNATKKKLILGILLTFGSALSFAKEGGVGNGGGVHVCPGQSPEMYDLYEGKRRFKLDIPNDGSRYEEIIRKALDRVTSVNITLEKEIADEIEFLEKGGFSFEEKLKLTLIPDANVLMVDEGCEYKQLANWDDVTKRVFVKNEYYVNMDELSKAALFLHEAVYSVSRKRRGVLTSDNSRRIVSQLLASEFKGSKQLSELNSYKDIMPGVGEARISLTDYSSDRSYFKVINVHLGSMNFSSKDWSENVKIIIPQIKTLAKMRNDLQDQLIVESTLSNREKKKILKKIESLQSEIDSFFKGSKFFVNLVLKDGEMTIPLSALNNGLYSSKDCDFILEFNFKDGKNSKKITTKISHDASTSSNHSLTLYLTQNPR